MPRGNDHRIFINRMPGLANPGISSGSCIMISADHPDVCGGCDRRNITLFYIFNFQEVRGAEAPASNHYSALMLCYDCAVFRLRGNRIRADRMYDRMRRWAQRQRRRERAVMQTQLRYTATANLNMDGSLYWGPMRVVGEEAPNYNDETVVAEAVDELFDLDCTPLPQRDNPYIIGPMRSVREEDLVQRVQAQPVPLGQRVRSWMENLVIDPLAHLREEVVAGAEPELSTAPEGLLAVHRRGYALGTRQRMDCMEIRNGRYAMHIADDMGRTRQRPFRVWTVQSGPLTGARLIKIELEGYLDGWRAVAALPIRVGQPLINYDDRLEPTLAAPIMEALSQDRSIHHCCILCNERTRLGHFCRDHSGMALQMMTTQRGWNYIGREFFWGSDSCLSEPPPRSEIREQLVQ